MIYIIYTLSKKNDIVVSHLSDIQIFLRAIFSQSANCYIDQNTHGKY